MKTRRESFCLVPFVTHHSKEDALFSWCPRQMFSGTHYPFFRAESSQSDVPDWTMGVKANLCKTVVDCLPGNSFCRNSSKVTSQLKSLCPTCQCALNSK
ncbi:hypothetical protein TNCV_643891 [Trichonephila clavipes]|nr:hypothetical protein TNCV_643891 [Trichonephila clavipes]